MAITEKDGANKYNDKLKTDKSFMQPIKIKANPLKKVKKRRSDYPYSHWPKGTTGKNRGATLAKDLGII